MVLTHSILILALLCLSSVSISVGAFSPPSFGSRMDISRWNQLPKPPTSKNASSGYCNGYFPKTILRSVIRPTKSDEIVHENCERRHVLRKISLALMASPPSLLAFSSKAVASGELFRPNPLTNPVLEQLRIWDQDEADNIKYGGELSSGSSKPAAFDQYVLLLQPILSVEHDISTIGELVFSEGDGSTNEDYVTRFRKMNEILSKPIFDKVNFKKAFNAFADNIYYTDPDRANLYLGGGAIPKSTQTLAYLLRNDVLTNIEDMRAEMQYLLRELEKNKDASVGGQGGIELDELKGFVTMAKDGMAKYLDLVPPKELEAARLKFNSQG